VAWQRSELEGQPVSEARPAHACAERCRL